MKPSLPKITEKEFMRQVIALAKLRGWRVYHTHDSRRSASGFPDLVLVGRRWVVVAELKVGDNLPTAVQYEWLDAFRRCSVAAFVWTPADWPEIERVLSEGGA